MPFCAVMFVVRACSPYLSQDAEPLAFTPPSVPRNERGRNDGYKRPYVVIASAKDVSPGVANASVITEFKIKVIRTPPFIISLQIMALLTD